MVPGTAIVQDRSRFEKTCTSPFFSAYPEACSSGCGRVPYKGTCCHNLIAVYLNPGIVIPGQFPEKIVGAKGMNRSKEKSGSGKEGETWGFRGFPG
ncbi:MAG TPA: hypothetical protein PK154_06665 [Methanoregulaceae archaeon]|nr:hypothetical protein [Methanoregulaceae archaeon]